MFYYEFFGDQDSLLKRVHELKDEDYFEEDFRLFAKEEDDEMKWLEYTNINFHPFEEDGGDGGLKGIFSSNEPAHRFLYKSDLEEDTVEDYLQKLDEGEYLLYYSEENKRMRENEAAGIDVSSEAELEVEQEYEERKDSLRE